MATNNQSGTVETSIDSIIRTFRTNIDFLQPIYEAITNAFEANASNIIIKFTKKDNLMNLNYIDRIDICDDGEGFTEGNINSFGEYMSNHKINLGCKGVGRFTWLKVFNKIQIDSYTEQTNVKINFSRFFNAKNDISIYKKVNSETKTTISFIDIIDDYKNYELNLEEVKAKIMDYFSLKFVDYKKMNKQFLISLNFENFEETISNDDIGELSKKNFTLLDQNNNSYTFEINYNFTENGHIAKNECYLCGNGRIVEEYKLNKIFSTLPENKYIKILVYSKYFDDRINAERTAFTFSKTENNPTIADPVPFSIISKELETNLEKIILDEFPQIQNDNEKVINKCIDDKPHLAKYIRNDTSLIKRENDVIKKAQNEFEKEKESVKANFIRLLEKKDVDSQELVEEFEKLNDLSCRELAQYFLYRQTIIDSLKRMNEDSEKIEKYLHKLFLELGQKCQNGDELIDRFNNCIWLLDDKYMSYEAMYSDAKISRIKEEIMSDNNSYRGGKEPDLTIFYSNHDIVVVEFKAIGASTDEKLSAYPEINRNLGIIAKNFDKINNIYGYVITKFNDEFNEYISEFPGVKTLFSTGKNPIYYIYNDNIKDSSGDKKNAHIYFISTDNIYSDANNRNKLFIDIIKNK